MIQLGNSIKVIDKQGNVTIIGGGSSSGKVLTTEDIEVTPTHLQTLNFSDVTSLEIDRRFNDLWMSRSDQIASYNNTINMSLHRRIFISDVVKIFVRNSGLRTVLLARQHEHSPDVNHYSLDITSRFSSPSILNLDGGWDNISYDAFDANDNTVLFASGTMLYSQNLSDFFPLSQVNLSNTIDTIALTSVENVNYLISGSPTSKTVRRLIHSSLSLGSSHIASVSTNSSSTPVMRCGRNTNNVYTFNTNQLLKYSFASTTQLSTGVSSVNLDFNFRNKVNGMYIDNNENVYLYTNDGEISVYNSQLEHLYLIKPVNNSINALVIDNRGHMIIATSSNVIKYRLDYKIK